MEMHRVFRFGIAALLAISLAGVQAADAREADTPLVLHFEKCDPEADFRWHGRVSGDLDGTLTTYPTFVDDSAPVWRVEFVFEIADTGSEPMTLHLVGTLNSTTGRVALRGTVVEGYLQGARVLESGQLVDPERSCFEGRIRIVPAAIGR